MEEGHAHVLRAVVSRLFTTCPRVGRSLGIDRDGGLFITIHIPSSDSVLMLRECCSRHQKKSMKNIKGAAVSLLYVQTM